MRVKKILKISSIVVVSLALLLLCLVAALLFNPFEGSLPVMRDVVPRGVDFYVHKANLSGDFDDLDNAPYVPELEYLGQTRAWKDLKSGSWYRNLELTQKLRSLRDELAKVHAQVPYIHVVRDLVGKEVQIAGRFGTRGFEDARWCMYSRVSWRGKAAHGAMAYGMLREQLRQQGIVISDEDDYYKIRVPNMPEELYVARYLDCMMVSNDKALLNDSYELAQSNYTNVEPLGTSAHYVDGVRRPLQRWQERTRVTDPNVVAMHLRPDQLIPKLPQLNNWPNPTVEDSPNERLLASFLNLQSFRFLSGSLIFEPHSFTFLSHLVVNNNKLTGFQRELFKPEVTPRGEWMNRFFQMVPKEACGAAALRLPAGAFIREMVGAVRDKDERNEINNAIRRTGQYKGLEDLIAVLGPSLRSRVGIVMRPNRRTEDRIKTFKVMEESPYPQWAVVFWVRKGLKSGRPLNKPLKDLILLINQHRHAFGIQSAWTLGVTGSSSKADVAFEFGIPFIEGTGSIAICTYGEYFIFGNSGPFIRDMISAMTKGNSRRQDDDFDEFVSEMPEAVNGVCFVWADRLKEVCADLEGFADRIQEDMDPVWGLANRSRAEQRVFQRAYRQFRTKARIPNSQRSAFESAVDTQLKALWREHAAGKRIADKGDLRQFRQLVGTFRSAYLQMVLDSTSLQIWGRVLGPEYVVSH